MDLQCLDCYTRYGMRGKRPSWKVDFVYLKKVLENREGLDSVHGISLGNNYPCVPRRKPPPYQCKKIVTIGEMYNKEAVAVILVPKLRYVPKRFFLVENLAHVRLRVCGR